MIHETISLPFGGKDNARLTTYCIEKNAELGGKCRPTVLVIPGGGYKRCSLREQEPVALRFNSYGYNAAVLTYTTGDDARFPQSLCEAALAIAYLRRHHEKYCVDPDRIFTCGFSAGGHLALSLGVHWDKKWLSELVGKENEALRPNAQILGYPVVSADPSHSHGGSFKRLLGDNPDENERMLVSLDTQITENTPPTFLWSTFTDGTVPVKNSLLLADALYEKNVPTEIHIYGWGPHGSSLAVDATKSVNNTDSSQSDPHLATWMNLCLEWLGKMFPKA